MKKESTNTEKLEDLILSYKYEKDNKKKHVLYLNLVQEALKFVKKIVLGFYPLPSNISKDDLIQVGAIGLLKAISTYESKEKGSFKTYSSIYIRGKILQYLRDKVNLVKPPRETIENSNLVKEYLLKHEDNDNIPSAKEIASALKMSEKCVQEILDIELLKNIISLDQKVYSIDGVETLADRIQADADKNYEENYENKKLIEYAINKLPKQEKEVIYHYYIEGETKKYIAEKLNISATQVARLIKKALNKMYIVIEKDYKTEEGK